jgi:uncharacterized protein YjiS (DUF1127 family)
MGAHVRVQPQQPALSRPASEEWARIDPVIYVTAARRLQAQAMSEAAGAGWRGIRRALTGPAGLARRYLLEPLVRRSQRQRALAELGAMDERLLADIGLRRSDIELAVDGRLADPRMTRRASAGATAVSDRLLEGERCPTSAVPANANRPSAATGPDRVPGLAA